MAERAISVVIPTFERPESCARAVASALAQDAAPLEVLVCDDASGAAAVERLEALAASDPRIRLLPAAQNSGSPAAGRRRGIEAAAGEWIALLDDDDAWLPGKLRAQLARVAAGDVDVLGTNARRSDGTPYFADTTGERVLDRAELLRHNPLITSSVLARRDVLLGGDFPSARWTRGIEDYALWLSLSDASARFAVLGAVLVDYDSGGEGRLSSAPLAREAAVARLALGRWRRHPSDAALRRAAAHRSAEALRVARDLVLQRAAGVARRAGYRGRA